MGSGWLRYWKPFFKINWKINLSFVLSVLVTKEKLGEPLNICLIRQMVN